MIEENNVNPIQNPNQMQEKVNGLNIAALVLGIVSIVLWCVWFISIPCSILALIFGIIGIKKKGKGLALAGIITGAISMAIWIFIFVAAFMFGFVTGIEESFEDYDYDYDYEYYDDYYDDYHDISYRYY